LNIKIDNHGEKERISVFNMMGKEVEMVAHLAVNSSLELGAALKPNMYIVQDYGANRSTSFKVLKIE